MALELQHQAASKGSKIYYVTETITFSKRIEADSKKQAKEAWNTWDAAIRSHGIRAKELSNDR